MKNNSLDILKQQGSGFKTPKGYFDSVEDSVFSKLTSEKFSKKSGFKEPNNYFKTVENSVFQKIKKVESVKEVNFDVPKGYFESIEDHVFERITKEDEVVKIQPKNIDFKSRFIKVFTPIAVAASLLLFFIINYNTKTDFSIDNLANAEIENWIDENLITLDLELIAEVFNDVSLEEELNDEDMEMLEYLNGTDIESILLNN